MATSLTLRQNKGSPLTFKEGDDNFLYLDGKIDAVSATTKIYDTKAAGLAATKDNDTFWVIGSGDVAATLYRRVNSTTATELASSLSTQFKADLADPAKGAELVADVARYVNVKSRGAKGDEVTIDQAAIETAVADAKSNGANVWWPYGTYISTDSIAGFWDVKHFGPGVISRGGKTWHITPKGNEQNNLWVTADADDANDGLFQDSPITAAEAFRRISLIGYKALDGRWAIQFRGTINHEGVRFPPLPVFKNRLLIAGESVPVNTQPTTVWDGAGSSLVQALRSELNNAPSMFLSFRDIHFKNWDKTGLSGAIFIWDAADIEVRNIWADDCAVGVWARRSNLNVVGGVYTRCSVYGIAAQYGSVFDIGQRDRSQSITFNDCGLAVSGSRNSVGYVKGCTFNNCRTDIGVSRNSRVRPQNNAHNEWIDAAYDVDLMSVLTPDNGDGYPDTFTHTDPSSNVYNGTSNAVHMLMQRGRAKTVHLVSNAEQVIISGSPGASVLLSSSNSTFVPFRLPRFALKTPDIRLECEIFVFLVAGATGRLAINGDGPGDTTARLASILLPSLGVDGNYKVKFSIQRSPGSTQFRWTAEYQQFGLTNGNNHAMTYGTANNVNSGAISQFSEDVALFRLYWEPTTAAEARFYGMRTYIE